MLLTVCSFCRELFNRLPLFVSTTGNLSSYDKRKRNSVNKHRGGKLPILTVVCILTTCTVFMGVVVGKLTTTLLIVEILTTIELS